jgi:histidine ammonia-lyase
MSMAAALKASRALELARQVIAVEVLCACQAIDLLAPLTSSAPLMRVHETIRARVPMLERDRPPSHDIAQITAMIETSDLERACALKVK